MTILSLLIGISCLFLLLLLVKALLPKRLSERLCALCAAVSLTWLTLLLLLWHGTFQDRVLLALLMGTSVTGSYYLAEKRVREQLHLFRLPFFLTLLLFAYSLLSWESIGASPYLFIIGLWLLFGIIFAYRTNRRFQKLFDRIVDCCKRW